MESLETHEGNEKFTQINFMALEEIGAKEFSSNIPSQPQLQNLGKTEAGRKIGGITSLPRNPLDPNSHVDDVREGAHVTVQSRVSKNEVEGILPAIEDGLFKPFTLGREDGQVSFPWCSDDSSANELQIKMINEIDNEFFIKSEIKYFCSFINSDIVVHAMDHFFLKAVKTKPKIKIKNNFVSSCTI